MGGVDDLSPGLIPSGADTDWQLIVWGKEESLLLSIFENVATRWLLVPQKMASHPCMYEQH